MSRFSRRSLTLTVAVLMVALASCGKQKDLKITGRLLRDGKPVVLQTEAEQKMPVTLMFIPLTQGQDDRRYPAKFDPSTGNYEVTLPAGKYRVNIFVPDPKRGFIPPPPNKAGNTEQDGKTYELLKPQELDLEAPAPPVVPKTPNKK
jgi:hypothetical protein